MADQCLFCRIVKREIPAKIVATSEACVAFRDVNPQAPTHVLVVPKVHVESLNQVTDASVVAAMMAMAADVARSEGIAESGYRVVFNTNAHGGQTGLHLHLHLLGGRALGWPPG